MKNQFSAFPDNKRMSRSELIRHCALQRAAKSGYPIDSPAYKRYVNEQEELLMEACKDITNGIVELAQEGYLISIFGFGRFCVIKHKGHAVNFDGNPAIPDYPSFKFYAANSVKNALRGDTAQQE